jgi:hypothetical protein
VAAAPRGMNQKAKKREKEKEGERKKCNMRFNI